MTIRLAESMMMMILILIWVGVYSQEVCSFSMFCQEDSEENEEECMKVNLTEANGIYDIGFRECESQRRSYCNVYHGLIQPYNYISKCIERPKKILSYPGGKCSNDNDCKYGLCMSNKCIDSDKDKECYRDESCPIGTACFFTGYKGLCKPLLSLNDKCTKSTQCQIDQLCASGACTAMYCIEDNTDISSYKDSNPLKTIEELAPLCRSNFAIELSNSVIKCARVLNVKNLNDQCYEHCQYKFNDQIVTVPNSCRCAFNHQRSKHCILGSGEPAYEDYLALRRAIINDPLSRQYCHTTERENDAYCAEMLKTIRTVAFRKKVKEYNNKKIEALEHHRMINADDCIKTVVFDYDTTPVVSDKKQCAAYNCNEKSTYCLNGTNPLNEDGNMIEIDMNDKVCSEHEICVIKPLSTGVDFIYENDTIHGECLPKKQAKMIRLPGEDCSIDTDCYHNTCLPDVKKCKGSAIDEECISHFDCNVGLYCDKNHCKRQRKEGESCKSSWDCLNYLGCYSHPATPSTSQCMIFGQVGDIDITQILSKWTDYPYFDHLYSPSDIGASLMCRSGQLSVSKKHCGVYEYDISYPMMNKEKENDDRFIECQADSDCYYIDNYGEKTRKKCECGYNAEGKGYCPLPNTINKDDWMELNQYRSSRTDNQCHSLSRFNCYLLPDDTYMTDIEFRTTKAHFFYKAVKCAYKVLSSPYLHSSSLTLLILLMI